MRTNIFLIVIFACSLAMVSCELDEPKVKHSSTYPLNGEWGVVYREETSPGVFEDVYEVGYTPLTIYNTAADDGDSIWITDNENFWDFKIKTAADAPEKSFSSSGSEDYQHGIDVMVTDGKVILDAVTTKGAGTKTDSIYFKIEFGDDAGRVWHCSGVRRTGYLEDDEIYGF